MSSCLTFGTASLIGNEALEFCFSNTDEKAPGFFGGTTDKADFEIDLIAARAPFCFSVELIMIESPSFSNCGGYLVSVDGPD